MFTNHKHGYHLVDPSPWPTITAFSAFLFTFGLVLSINNFKGSFLWIYGLYLILFMMFIWWRDIIREGTLEGQHTLLVKEGLQLGILLFIVSEIMFFFAFFWAFFHSSFNPSIILGAVWPPMFLTILNPWEIPLLNTVLLLSSGATITLSHHALIFGDKIQVLIALLLTIILAIIFTILQVFEYVTAPFNISDSIYGATFYMATGFHGFHVLVGTSFLFVCFFRIYLDHMTRSHHFGFEAAIWYWHFVDVVWLFLFITIYWWGS